MFLTKKVNKAGIYALQFFIGGVKRVIVVDDYFPTKISKDGSMKLAFSKSSAGENELWMMIVEKAYAKLCGSYEAMEKQVAGPNEGLMAQTSDWNAITTLDEKQD